MNTLFSKLLTGLLVLIVITSGYSQTQKAKPKPKTGTKSTVKVPPKKVPPPVDGFWLVTKVTVGPREVTPASKWMKLGDGKHVTGNGWVQHSFGTYKFDKEKSELTLITTNEPLDDFGPFKVVRTGPLMTWSRQEEGQLVVVDLKPITELPKAPSDEVKGLWTLETAVERDVDITKRYDADHKHFLFVRWDHQYVRQLNAHERVSGYWVVESHRPLLTLFSENRDEETDEQWMVTITDQKMVLKGNSGKVKDMVLTYRRATEFPK